MIRKRSPRVAKTARTLALTVGLLIALVGSSVPAAAVTTGAVLDQSQTATGLGASINRIFAAAQTFQAGMTGFLTDASVYVYLGKLCTTSGVGCPAPGPGSLIVQLHAADATGVPTDTILSSATIPSNRVGLGFGNASWVDATFAVPAPVTSGTIYALVLTSSAGSRQGGGYYAWSDVTSDSGTVNQAYPNGQGWSAQNGAAPWDPSPSFDFSFQTYVVPNATSNPAPTLTGLNPTADYAGDSGFTITVTGAGFAVNSTVQWNGSPRATTFVSATQLTAQILGADIATAGAAEVTVATSAPGGGTSAPQAFFITATQTTVTGASSGTSTDPGGTAAASTGGAGAATPGSVSASASGSGTLSVAEYAADPVPTPDPNGASAYFDVHVASGSVFNALTVVDCNLSGAAGTTGYGIIDWWDGTQWSPVSNQQYDPTTNCTTLAFTGVSAPNLTQLAGTPFASVLDRTPPVTTASLSGTQGSNGWYKAGDPVRLTLTAKDTLSGVATTTYTVNGGAAQAYTAPITFTDGVYTVAYHSTDKAGNAEAAKAISFTIDRTAPTTTATPTGMRGTNGWYTSAVSVTLSASDGTGGSGVAKTEYNLDNQGWVPYTAAVSIAADGTHTLLFRSTDAAGNVETAKSLTLHIDTTKPAITADATPNSIWPPNHKLVPISVTIHASDGGSGIAGVSLVSVTSSEPDNGLSGGATPNDIQGWATGPVTLNADGTATIGGQVRAERSGAGPGRVYTITFQVTDKAGNSATGTTTASVPHNK